jgi:hypothetical protein
MLRPTNVFDLKWLERDPEGNHIRQGNRTFRSPESGRLKPLRHTHRPTGNTQMRILNRMCERLKLVGEPSVPAQLVST